MTHRQYYVLKIDGQVNSAHRSFMDAVRAGLRIKNEFPRYDIKVRVAQDSFKEEVQRSAAR